MGKSTLAAVAAHPGVQRETVLYQYALRRFERDVAGVSQLEEKAARLKSAMQVAEFCPLQRCDGRSGIQTNTV